LLQSRAALPRRKIAGQCAACDEVALATGSAPWKAPCVAVGNALLGVPFRLDDTLRMTYEGNLLGLLNPFGFSAASSAVR
jgi:hypothetical protein